MSHDLILWLPELPSIWQRIVLGLLSIFPLQRHYLLDTFHECCINGFNMLLKKGAEMILDRIGQGRRHNICVAFL